MSQQEQPVNIFALQPDYYKHVQYYDIIGNVDEESLLKYLKANEFVHSFYFVNEKKNLIIVSKDKTKNSDIDKFITEYKDVTFSKGKLPYSNFNSVLVTEITDNQLKRISKDKSVALKLIESQTGLKLKKQKKTFYFSGLTYQFTLLDELFSKYPEIDDNDETTQQSSSSSSSIAFDTSANSLFKNENENITLAGTKQDLDVFYDINSNYIKVDQDPYDDKIIKWIVGFDNKSNIVLEKAKESTNNNRYGSSQLKISVSSDNKRSVTGVPYITSNDSSIVCLFCQSEDVKNLIICNTAECNTAFCKKCFIRKYQNNNSKKCPNCPNYFELPEVKKVGFSEGYLNYEFFEEPCEGYDRSGTIQFTYTCEDGIQNAYHPEPGKPYRGTQKFWFIPAINNSKELTNLFLEAFRKGLLFQLDINRKTQQYQIYISENILLKTNTYGGGRFSYPDQSYVREITNTLRNLLNK